MPPPATIVTEPALACLSRLKPDHRPGQLDGLAFFATLAGRRAQGSGTMAAAANCATWCGLNTHMF